MLKKVLKDGHKPFELLTDIYIFFIILIFPFIVDSTGFYKILECKWHAYVFISLLYVISIFCLFLYYLIVKKINYFSKIKFSLVQWAALLFLGFNVLSFLFSPYLNSHDLLIGVGRGEGLIVTSLYVISFVFVSIFAKFKGKYFLYFSVSLLLFSLICILQYVGFNPFNMYQDGLGTHNVSFMGTIGNKDFISAYYTLFLTIVMSSYIFLNNSKKYKLLYLLSIFMGFFIFGIINVTSGSLSFLLTLVIFLPYIVLNSTFLVRFLRIVAIVIGAYVSNVIINPVYYYSINKIIFEWQFNNFVIIFLIVITLLCLISFWLEKFNYNVSNNKNVIKCYYLGILGLGVISLVGIYFINFSSGFLYEIHEILHGNFADEFGTYRIFLWKRTIALWPDHPLLGSGPDSFALRFMSRYASDVAAIGPLTINDTAANIYLTMLINLGLLGLFSYLFFVFVQLRFAIKNGNVLSFVLISSMTCYLIQSFFNLSVVIVSPFFWITMALMYKSTYFIDNNSN